MNGRKTVQPLRGRVKLAAALLLAGILLSGILAAPAAAPVHALSAFPQVIAPSSTSSTGVNGTLASFTALFTQIFSINVPFVGK